jgi:hypothetical protein
MTRVTALLALSLALAGCGTLGDALAPLDETDYYPVPQGLDHPELWVYLRSSTGVTRWVRPLETDEDRAREVAAAAAAEKPPPRPRYRGKWVEQFEYRRLGRPSELPDEYALNYRDQMRQTCPDSVIRTLRASDKELLLEVVTSGCEPFGDEDELLRLLFDQPDFIELGYTVKVSAMTPEQRKSGMAALYAFKFEP